MTYRMKYKKAYWSGEERLVITLDGNLEAKDDREALEKARKFIEEKNEQKHREEIEDWDNEGPSFSVDKYELFSLTRIDQEEITTPINIYQ